ncbi:hypothetical protein [Streptomyces sp. NPDC097610]|uniref:hypothetical protein n=1 Tax=Streptomyces sp. NPDC097610 TaxID=3157227 RepID=UPI003330D046
MSPVTTTEGVEPKSISLDAPGLGVSADDVDAYAELAADGLVGAGANNCNAVQNNAALRPDTTVTLKPVDTPASA